MVEIISWKDEHPTILESHPGIAKWMDRINELDTNTFKVAVEEVEYLLDKKYVKVAEEVVRETVLVMENDKSLGKDFLKKSPEWLEYIENQGERWPWYIGLSEEEWLAQKERFGIPTVAEKYIALVKPLSAAAYSSNNYKFDARTLIKKLIPMLNELDNDLEELYFDIGYLTRKR